MKSKEWGLARTRARELSARMTLDEKVGQINQKLFGWQCYEKTASGYRLTQLFKDEVKRFDGMGFLYGLFRADPWSRVNEKNGIPISERYIIANMIQDYVRENTRLKIPVLLFEEAPHGHQALGSVVFPTNIGAACSFNPGLFGEVFKAIAGDLRASGAHLGGISLLDMACDPRWGRTEETLGEDPFLASEFALAAVQGAQEGASNGKGIAVIAKHFAGQGACAGGKNATAAPIGQRELREIHLAAMRKCCGEGVLGVMAAYNELDGVRCHANNTLLKDILRSEFGFDGIVISDGGGVDNLNQQTGSSLASGALALESGVDVGLWGEAFSKLGEAARQNSPLIEFIDTAAQRCLTLKFYMGLIDNPQTPESNTAPLIENSRELAYTMAAESAVLLKNDGLLPLKLKEDMRIAVLGPNGDSLYNLLGDYTAPQQADSGSTIFGAIKAAFKGCDVRYAKGCNIRTSDSALLNAAINLAKESDIIVFALGGSSTRDFKTEFSDNGAAAGSSLTKEMDCGEGVDLADIALHSCQTALVTVVSALKKPQIALLAQGRPYAITDIVENVNAALCLWYPGIEGGRAAADLLLGTVNPSGKLSVSIPRCTGQLPVNYNKKFSGRNTPYADCTAAPLYPFGYGLSYADFSVEKVKLEFMPDITGLMAGKQAVVSAVIKNNSSIGGKAVLSGYVFDCESSVCQREAQLKAFVKTDIPPNSEKSVKLHFGNEAFEVWGRNGNYLIERGNAVIKIGLNPDALTEITVQLR